MKGLAALRRLLMRTVGSQATEPAVAMAGSGASTDIIETDPQALSHQIQGLGLGPTPLLEFLERYLESLNWAAVEPNVRFHLVNIVLGHLVPAIDTVMGYYAQEPWGVPEPDDQCRAFGAASAAAQRAAACYKRIFDTDLQTSPRPEGAAADRLAVCGVRVLELIRLEQWLLALRYQRLRPQRWMDANECFFVLRQRLESDQPRSVQVRIHCPGDQAVPLTPHIASADSLFVTIHMLGMLDPVTWPSHYFYALNRYLQDLAEPLHTEPDASPDLSAETLVIYRDHLGPAQYSRPVNASGESVQLAVGPLRAQAQEDLDRLLRQHLVGAADTAAVSEALELVVVNERLPFVDLLIRRLTPSQRQWPREHVYQTETAWVYCGFRQSYLCLRASASGEAPDSLDEALASQAVMVAASDNPYGDDTCWRIVDKGPGGVQLRIQETRFTVPLRVGQMVAYGIETAEAAPTLGYVVRLNRPGERVVEVAVAALSQRAEAVAVAELQSKGAERGAAILIQDLKGRWCLVLPRYAQLPYSEGLDMYRGERQYRLHLGGIRLAQAEFVVYEISARG